MDFSKLILGKSIADLTYVDIEKFFSINREESDNVEYKSYVGPGTLSDRLKSIFKGVCAMANSNGGIIIWGAPDGDVPPGQKEKIFQGELTSIDNTIEKDNLVSRITSNLIPGLSNFKCKVLSKGGRKVAIIEINQSYYAPHQTGGRYYMRLDGQSVPAPHHFIEALFKKIRYPNLEGYVKTEDIRLTSRYFMNINVDIYIIRLKIGIFNFSPLQNDELVSWQIVWNYGMPRIDEYLTLPSTEQRDNHLIKSEQPVGMLGFVNPIKEIVEIELRVDKFNDHKRQVYINFFFAGKNSPTKVSRYIVAIPKNSLPKHFGDNKYIKHVRFFSMEENKLLHELENSYGSSKEDFVRDFLF